MMNSAQKILAHFSYPHLPKVEDVAAFMETETDSVSKYDVLLKKKPLPCIQLYGYWEQNHFERVL